MKKRLKGVAIILAMSLCLVGCGSVTLLGGGGFLGSKELAPLWESMEKLGEMSLWGSKLNDFYGQLIGNSFECRFYDNYGNLFLTAKGTKIGMTGNVVEETSVNSSSGYRESLYTLSSVITINIDGKQIQSCGDTIIFEEKGLSPDTEFALSDIEGTPGGKVSDNTLVSGIVNRYKNYFGKPQVVIIQSQMGVPICAYSGNDVYWEVRDDLPKTTKLMIDGKALYIHRANFQIIDAGLLN